MTTIVCPTMYCGVPKNRAALSARRPNASSPKVLLRCAGAGVATAKEATPAPGQPFCR